MVPFKEKWLEILLNIWEFHLQLLRMCTLFIQFRFLTKCGPVLATFDLGFRNLLYLSMGLVRQQRSELHALSKVFQLTELCFAISSSLPYRIYRRIVCFCSFRIFPLNQFILQAFSSTSSDPSMYRAISYSLSSL